MARIRADYVFGTTDVAIDSDDTALSSVALARLPVVSGGDVAVITLYDAEAGAYEIVHVTAHTASAITATILRAQEGSTAQSWASGTTWLHGPTAADFAAAATPDAENIAVTPAGNINATTVQAALEELDDEKVHVGGTITKIVGPITQATYDGLTPTSDTLYVIVG